MASNNLELTPLETMGPVCALRAFSDEFVFTGDGPLLSLHNYIKGEKVLSRQVLPRNKIHGVQVKGSRIAVWGGQHFSVFSMEEFNDLEFDLPIYGVGDWITYVLLSSSGLVEILSAHNLVHTAKIVGSKLELLSTKNCGWKSILYSGSLHEDTETGLISVLAGTVMNGIILWDLETCKVNHNLTEHEGSIFNVTPSADGKYLASCSDDRSIKVWDMKTGELLANGWGHGSRIWGISIYNSSENGFNIFSASEDLTARVWTFARGVEELTQDRIVYGHTGRHVWSVDVYSPKLIGFTGGADGKVLLTDLGEDQRPGYLRSKWELSDIKVGVKFTKGELFKEYVDFGFGLLAITTLGKVLVLKQYTTWEFLFEDEKFERFCIAKGFENSPIVIMGNKFGDVYMLKFSNENGELVEKKSLDVKNSLSRLANILVNEAEGNKLSVFYESSNPNDPILFNQIDENLEITQSKELSKPNEKIVLNTLTYDSHRDLFIFGCRFATLLFYKLSQSNEPYATLPKIIKGDTMSAIQIIPNTEKCTIYVTNKDSNYYIVEFDNEIKNFNFIQSSRIQRGFLEGIAKGLNNDVLLFGFKSDCFFLWNETGQYEVFREICGGPHRRWSFKSWIQNGELKYRFVYTRASEVQIVQNGESFGVATLTRGLHGRETRDVAIVDGNNDDEKIVITGAEDTTLKISTLKKNGDLIQHWTFREHVAGMQSVHAVNNEFILSTSAREELFVWRLKSCDDKKCMALYAKLPPASANPDLRIMNFDTIEVLENGEVIGFLLVSVYSDSNIKINYFDIQSKKFTLIINDYYQQCCIFHSNLIILDGSLYLLIGSTNGHATIYDITARIQKDFQIGLQSLKLISLVSNDVTKLDNLIINQQLHQSSIKALELINKSSNEVILVTGGDDNALIVSTITNGDTALELNVKAIDESAASSTITTINKVDAQHVLVAGVDQMVKLWTIVDTKGEETLELIDSKYTTVADTGCSDITEFKSGEKLVFLGGAGASIWKV